MGDNGDRAVIDIDAVRAIRAEQSGQGPIVRFGGKEYELPPRAPLALLEHLSRYFALRREWTTKGDKAAAGASSDAMISAAKVLIGDVGWEEWRVAGAELEDVLNLLSGATRAYGLGDDVGESSGSPSSSTNGRASSRRTSRATTR